MHFHNKARASRNLAFAILAAAIFHAPFAAAAEAIAERDMLRYCQGEASAEFGVKPTHISMKELEKADHGAMLAHGSYDDNGTSVAFRCRFGGNGQFRWVRTSAQHDEAKGAGGPSDRQLQSCNAVKDRYGEVLETTPLKPGAFEIILKYEDGNYVCDVEANGKVTYFEKLR